MEVFVGQVMALVMLWMVLCGLVYMVHRPSAVRLAWWPLRLLRRMIGWGLIELGKSIMGGKKK